MNEVQEEVIQVDSQAQAEAKAEAKVEAAITATPKDRAPIRVDERGLAFESAAELYRMAAAFVAGGVAPKGSSAGGCMAAMLKGRALGLDIITSVTSIVVIAGRTQMSGALILGLLKRAGIKYVFGWEGDGNTLKAWIQAWDPARGEKRGTWPMHEFSMGDAVRAGLVSRRGDTYRAWPREMLLWRAVSKMGRQQFPDVCAGIYVHGEIPGDPHPNLELEGQALLDETPPQTDPLIAELSGGTVAREPGQLTISGDPS